MNKIQLIQKMGLDIFKEMPVDSNYFFVLFGKVNYLKYDGDASTNNVYKTPHIYINGVWCKNYIGMSWDSYKLAFNVINGSDFKFLVVKKFPVEILGYEKVRKIISEIPSGAETYNYLSDKYYKTGNHGVAQASCGVVGCLNTDWMDSYHSNQVADDLFINLFELKKSIEKHKRPSCVTYI